jgi:hypothetical protein
MQRPDEITRARITVARQLYRKDIGPSHQRAFLHGLLSALEWVEGSTAGNARALQRLCDGEEVAADSMSRIGGSPLSKIVGKAGNRPDLEKRYQEETGDTDLAGYVAWLEGQVAGVGLLVL